VVDREHRLSDCSALLSTLDDTTGDLAANKRVASQTESHPPEGSLSEDDLVAPTIQKAPVASAAPQPTPSGKSNAPTPMGWAIPVVGAVILGGASFAAVGLFVTAYVATGAAGQRAPCGVGAGQAVGVVKVGTVFLKKPGAVWQMPSARTVHASPPSEDNDWQPGSVTCTLPAGTKLTVVDAPYRAGRAGNWITVQGGKIKLPEPDKD
jgi:hypothetical protein